ncbi:MAG: prenyltransferase [Candidatus Nezhaarchaeota archaeon]|nr:prenyltransferase [Candidatus Nezhaarchaeota archaeon]
MSPPQPPRWPAASSQGRLGLVRRLKAYLELYNPRFILDPVGAFVLGAATAYYFTESVDWPPLALAFAAVNLMAYGSFGMNEYGGYVIGTDKASLEVALRKGFIVREAASGNLIVRGVLSAEQAFRASVVAYALAAALGFYLVFTTGLWELVPVGLFAAFCGAFYEAPPFKLTYRAPLAHEALIVLNITVLVSLVACYVQMKALPAEFWLLVAPTALASLHLRLLTSMPDWEADVSYGRKVGVKYLGPERAYDLGLALFAASCLWLALLVAARVAPPLSLAGLAYAPIAARRMLEARGPACQTVKILGAIRAASLHMMVSTRLVLAASLIATALLA